MYVTYLVVIITRFTSQSRNELKSRKKLFDSKFFLHEFAIEIKNLIVEIEEEHDKSLNRRQRRVELRKFEPGISLLILAEPFTSSFCIGSIVYSV